MSEQCRRPKDGSLCTHVHLRLPAIACLIISIASWMFSLASSRWIR